LPESHTTYYHSPVGVLRITGTEDFISEVTFFDKVQNTEGRKRNLPPLMIQCIEQLIQYFHGELRRFELPIVQTGTPFQQEVWSALMAIPFGRTISYIQLARRIGDPKAIRAVGTANGRNNVAIIVPCHRVIGSNSDLVGYMGGLWRKKWLLEHEAKVAHGVQTLF
jgi:methylated-DNA-[protein]-cysteine S-methyltransferase